LGLSYGFLHEERRPVIEEGFRGHGDYSQTGQIWGQVNLYFEMAHHDSFAYGRLHPSKLVEVAAGGEPCVNSND